MQAMSLVSLALSLILRDPKGALRVTILPFLAAILLPALLRDALTGPAATGMLPRLAIEGLYLACVAWMAVAWHRFALTGAVGWPIPPAPPARVGAYLGGLVVLEMMIAAITAAVLLIAPLSLAGASQLTFQALLYLGLLIGYLLYGRLGAILPAVALGRVTRPPDGWRATRGATLAITLACLALLATEEIVFRSLSALPVDPRVATILATMAEWPVLMLGVALLTATYLRFVNDESSG